MMKAACQMPRLMLVTAIMLLVLVSCKPKRPDGILSPTQMEDLLVDYHLAQGMAEANSGERSMEELRYIYIRAALRKHHIEEAVFDSSMVYYSANSEQMAVICAHVCSRIEALGGDASAGTGDQDTSGKYAHLTAQGDTANVWTGMQHTTLTPDILHNLLVHTWQADSATHAGDSFIWHCYSQKVAQSNLPDVYVQMIIRYENDTVVSTTSRIYGDRETELSYIPVPPLDSVKPTSVTAMVFMSTREQTTSEEQGKSMAEALLLRDISLIRMHKKPAPAAVEPAPAEANTDSSETRKGAPTLVPASPRGTQGEEPKERLTPAQLRDAHPHAATIHVQKERDGQSSTPRRGMTPLRKVRH